MITWVTVWVLTITSQVDYANKSKAPYQFTYATQKICNEQGQRMVMGTSQSYSCNFQQVPVYVPKWGK